MGGLNTEDNHNSTRSNNTMFFSPSSRPTNMIMRAVFALLVLQRSFRLGSCDSFCLNTLSRPSCPDLQTFDQFNLTAYGGRWYEIGGNGFFLNVEQAGGTCVTADVAVLTNSSRSPTKKSMSVVTSFSKQIGPIATSVVQGISLRAGELCGQARQICSQTHVHGDLYRGLALIDGLASKIAPNFSLEGDGLLKAKVQIEDAVATINETLETLAGHVAQLQLINANLSQALGDQGERVFALTELARLGSAGADDILAALHEVGQARLQVTRIAGLLFGISNAEQYLFGENSSITTERAAVQLFKAAGFVQSAEESIHGPLAVIKATLLGAAQSTAMFTLDSTAPSGPTPFLQGLAVPAAENQTGRLVMSSYYSQPQDGPPALAVPDPSSNSTASISSGTTNSSSTWSPSTAGNYWILAAEGKAETGYDAVLVYGCHQHPSGGVRQPLFILSRNPTLAQGVVNKFFNVMAALGIDQECAEPFVFSEQGESCVYAPLPVTNSSILIAF